MKKLTSLLLALALLMSLCASAVAEENKPFKGQTITVWGVGKNPETVNYETNSIGMVIWAAVEEWAYENECNIEYLDGNISVMRGTIDSGDNIDLAYTSNNWPNEPLQGLCEPLSAELQADLSALHGDGIMNVFRWEDGVYAALCPWMGTSGIQFNLTKCQELDIKTPLEYVAENNWTYETYFQFLRDCTLDLDGDGHFEFQGMTRHDLSGYINPHVLIDETGHMVNLLDTPRQRAWFDLVYNAFVVDKSLQDKNFKLKEQDGTYVLSALNYNWRPFTPDGTFSIDKNGDVISCVPLPTWTVDDTEQQYFRHMQHFIIPVGAEHMDASEDLLKFIFERVMAEVEMTSYRKLTGKYRALTGCTEVSRKVLEGRKSVIDGQYEDLYSVEEYDEEVRIRNIDWFFNNNDWYIGIEAPGVTRFLTVDTAYEAMWTLPTATSFAQIVPVIQGQVDSFNAMYVDGLAD